MLSPNQGEIHFLKKYLLIIPLILICFGAIFIYSASAALAINMHHKSSFFIKKYLFGLMIGCCSFLVARAIPLELLKKYSFLCWLGSIGLTGLTLWQPTSVLINGSRRWAKIGKLIFQPSELLKISFILLLAHYFSHSKREYTFRTLFPFVAYCAITAFILLKQPDFGLAMTLITIASVYFFIIYPSIEYTAGLLVIMAAIALKLISLKEYRMQRIITFLNPWQDPQGKGFQIIQSFIAIGSGGLWGVGLTQSKQKLFYLPMQHTDFIFSIIAEEIGFMGALFIICLFILFLYYGIKASLQMKSRFSALSLFGFTLLISLQACINIAVTVGVVPTKGIGLPFISYGNSGLVVLCTILGLMNNFISNNKTIAQP
ncbi:cell division protein FtsW [bacterium]|nr:MAG: cell division protein FtsW [bacterium]QQR61788.1 MAG: cell division protein FtsW [bacterium]QQR62633.1 MAG: cell division protein FtsW [bacterium]